MVSIWTGFKWRRALGRDGTYQVVEDLVADDLDHVKRRHGPDRVHEHVPVDPDEVLRVQDAVLVLPGRVDNLRQVVLPLVPDRLGEGVLDGRVVALDEATVDELDRERRLACAQPNEVSLPSIEGPPPTQNEAQSREMQSGRGGSAALAKTYRQPGCRQWPSCAAWAPTQTCLWFCADRRIPLVWLTGRINAH